MQNAGTVSNDRQPPEERYRPQLEQLTAMGFTDQQANVQGKFFWYFFRYLHIYFFKC
jgi:hypothetical protein